MPRDGSGASDNGPIESGENLVHGTSGDAKLSHTSNVAPPPEPEKGFAVEGMNASGGGSTGVSSGAGDSKAAKDK